MLFANTISSCFKNNVKQLIRMSTNVSSELLIFKPKFSEEEQKKILGIVNEADIDQLCKFDVTRGRIKNLQTWRTKNGPFQTLSEILEVEGLGEKVLERLCNSIICQQSEGSGVPVVTKTSVNSKHRRQILTPQLCPTLAGKLKNVIGIHLAPTGVSWAKLCCDGNELQAWGYHDFSTLPKKLLPIDTFELAVDIMTKIPVGEVYTMESLNSNQGSGNKQPMPTYSQHLELSSMLLALLNTSNKHNSTIENKADSVDVPLYSNNIVYYLRSNLPARLFSTLVGTERVAVTGIITKLLDSSHSLPCTPIKMKHALQEHYGSLTPVHRDMMGQALLMVIAFMDLCVYNNQASLTAIAPGRRSNK